MNPLVFQHRPCNQIGIELGWLLYTNKSGGPSKLGVKQFWLQMDVTVDLPVLQMS